MAAHAGDLIKVVALLMQAGEKKNRLWRHHLTLRVIFMEAVNVNAEPGKDRVTGGVSWWGVTEGWTYHANTEWTWAKWARERK